MLLSGLLPRLSLRKAGCVVLLLVGLCTKLKYITNNVPSRIPGGHIRIDPKTQYFFCGPGLPPPTLAELAHASR